jgi:ParB family chromosome partitioning protein
MKLPKERTQTIPISRISPSPFQHRRRFDAESLRQLGASIRNDGLTQPIPLSARQGRFELIAGERRWRAAKLVSPFWLGRDDPSLASVHEQGR